MVLEQNDPGAPTTAASKLAKGKEKVTMTDAQRVSQLEDTVCGIARCFQNFMVEIYESLDMIMAENNAHVEAMTVETINTLHHSSLTKCISFTTS